MTTHARLSPSKRAQWKRCPGSVREQLKYPDPGSGPAAIDGTHSHTLLERCINANLTDPLSSVGITFRDHEGEFVVDKERAVRVKVAIDYIREQWSVAMAVDGVLPLVLAESRVDPEHLIGRSDMSGTVDVQIHSRKILELIDYKDGMGQVDVKGNDQLEQYAMGVLAGFKLPVNGDYPFETIRMTIVQPKLAMKGLPAISSYDISVKSMLGKLGTMVVEAAATDAPDAPLVPGDVQCKFCRAKGSCAALASNVMKEVGMMFQPVMMNQPAQVVELAQQSANKDPNAMTDAELVKIIEAAPLMRQLLEAVDAEALRRMRGGVTIPGLKLVNGRGSRAWSLPEDQIADKLTRMGVPKGSVWETKLVSPAKVEKLTWEATKAGEKITKQLSERQLKTVETEYVTKLAGKLTVAHESDSRPAVITNAAPMFGVVGQVPALPDWLK